MTCCAACGLPEGTEPSAWRFGCERHDWQPGFYTEMAAVRQLWEHAHRFPYLFTDGTFSLLRRMRRCGALLGVYEHESALHFVRLPSGTTWRGALLAYDAHWRLSGGAHAD